MLSSFYLGDSPTFLSFCFFRFVSFYSNVDFPNILSVSMVSYKIARSGSFYCLGMLNGL